MRILPIILGLLVLSALILGGCTKAPATGDALTGDVPATGNAADIPQVQADLDQVAEDEVVIGEMI
jgi:outer membrane murein-binding lipoprotein Lpp